MFSVYSYFSRYFQIIWLVDCYNQLNLVGSNGCYDQVRRNSCYDEAGRNSCYDKAGLNSSYNKAGRSNYYDGAGRIGILLRILLPRHILTQEIWWDQHEVGDENM